MYSVDIYIHIYGIPGELSRAIANNVIPVRCGRTGYTNHRLIISRGLQRIRRFIMADIDTPIGRGGERAADLLYR